MRKVLSFVLVLALVLSSFSMAFAADTTPATKGLTDINAIVNEEAIIVANDLGIVTGNPDGTFQPEKAVNRAEFAAMITRALGVPDTALTGYTATKFKDTTGYGWAVPYLAFCESKGIMLGDGAGNAMPGKTSTVNEAMTMVLRAVGYTANSAELVGLWPSNYVTKAQDLDLYDDVAAVATVDKANAAQIIYNALTINKVQVAADGETSLLGRWDTTEDPDVWVPVTMLTSGLNCKVDDAKVIDGEENTIINLSAYIGAYAVAYENSDDEIVAIGEVKSTFLTGDYDADENEFEANDVTYKTGSATFFDDAWEFVNNTGEAALATLAAVDLDDVTLAVELSGKTIKTIYSLNTWDVTTGADALVDNADIEGIDADQELLGVEFALTDDDEIDYDTFELVGVNSLKDIKEDNVVYVFAYGAGHPDYAGNIAKIAVGTTIVEGDITDYDGDTTVQSDATYTIAGKDYDFQNSYGVTPALDTLTGSNTGVGDTFKFYLDFQGYIYEAEEVESSPDTYAVVKYYETTGINDAQIKLYTSEDSTKTFNVDEDTAVVLETSFITKGAVTGTIIGYSLDKDGVIDGVDKTMDDASSGSAVGTKVFTVSGGAAYNISKDVVVFTVSDGEYDVVKIGDLEDELQFAAKYIHDGDDLVAILVDARDANASSDDTFAVFNKSTLTYDSDQDAKVNKVTGFESGKAFTKNANGDNIVTDSAITAGLYKIDFDGDGYIKEVTPITDTSEWDVIGTIGTTTISALDQDKTVVTIDGDNSKYELADDAVVYLYDVDDDEYSLSKVSSLRTGYTVQIYNTDADDNTEYDVVIFQK